MYQMVNPNHEQPSPLVEQLQRVVRRSSLYVSSITMSKFLQSNGHGDFQFSAGRARSNAIENSCLNYAAKQDEGPKLSSLFHSFVATLLNDSNYCTRHQLSPEYRHLQLDQQLANSVFCNRRNARVALMERN